MHVAFQHNRQEAIYRLLSSVTNIDDQQNIEQQLRTRDRQGNWFV
jgi:hypothetical protein